MSDSTIETATLHDLQFLLAAAREEGWNPGLADAASFYFTDPNGFFIERLNGEPIGCISAVAYNNAYAFMGLYIVIPTYRKQGYGIQLWNHAIDYLGNRSIGLDGVVAQQENYKKSGFAFFYNNFRYGGNVKGKRSNSVESLDTIPFQDLLDYDTSIYGVNRSQFLQHWITMPNAQGLAKRKNRQLTGYGVVRQCVTGYKIGPLFADDADTAEELFLSLSSYCEQAPLYLDIVQSNDAAFELAQTYQLEKIFETARMYRGTAPTQQLAKVFGVSTFELG